MIGFRVENTNLHVLNGDFECKISIPHAGNVLQHQVNLYFPREDCSSNLFYLQSTCDDYALSV